VSLVEPDRTARVSTLELFFDLVFVFTITQLTNVLVTGGDVAAIAQVVVNKDFAKDGNVICPPSGWTSVLLTLRSDGVYTQETFIRTTPLTAGSLNWVFRPGACTSTDNVDNNKYVASGGVIVFSGVDVGDPIRSAGGASGSSSPPHAAPSVAATPGDMVLRFFGLEKNTTVTHAATPSVPHVYVERSSVPSTSKPRTAAAFSHEHTAGATTGTFTVSFGESSEWTAQTIVLRMAAPATQPTTISDVSGSGTFAGTGTLTATLSSGATPLNNKAISFTLGGNPVGSATTNASGVAIGSLLFTRWLNHYGLGGSVVPAYTQWGDSPAVFIAAFQNSWLSIAGLTVIAVVASSMRGTDRRERRAS
jgi:hypothetical protein